MPGGASTKKRKADDLVEFDSLPESKRVRLAGEFRDVCVACDRLKLAEAVVRKVWSGPGGVHGPQFGGQGVPPMAAKYMPSCAGGVLQNITFYM